MLFLPPGSSRLTRVHGAYVGESEVESVVQFWKDQARPEYDQSFLLAPPSDDDETADGGRGVRRRAGSHVSGRGASGARDG